MLSLLKVWRSVIAFDTVWLSSLLLCVAEYAESPKGLKVGDRVKIDVDAQRLEDLQKERDAWDPELAKVAVCLERHVANVLCWTVSSTDSFCHCIPAQIVHSLASSSF